MVPLLQRLGCLTAIFFLSLPSLVTAQENPVLNRLLAKKLKEELSTTNSPDNGYRNGAHWLHFDDPDKHLTVELDVKQAERVELSGTAKAKIAFNYRVEETSNILGRRVVWVRHDFGGYADATLTLDASALPGEKLSDAKVKIKDVKVANLKMRSDVANTFRGPIQDFVNAALSAKKPDFEKKLEEALNKVQP